MDCIAAYVYHPRDWASNTFLPWLKLTTPQLSASLLRQLTYSTTRFGLYETLKSSPALAPPSGSTRPKQSQLIPAASVAGIAGGLLGNPADVLNVRMQHDAALPAAQRRNYRHAIHGLQCLVREEGLRGLLKGAGPNSLRAGLMTASQLASYDGFKAWIRGRTGWKDGVGLHLSASILAGFVATTVCSPVDVLKTRVMAESAGSGKAQGVLGLLKGVYEREGIKWMFRGWVPSFVRLGPHTVVTFLFLEQHKRLWRKLKAIHDH